MWWHDAGVEFLSDEWIDALDAAATARTVGDDDPLAEVMLTLEQQADAVAWRLIVDRGAVSVRWSTDDDAPADVRLSCSTEVARRIFSGSTPPIEAFMNGDLRIGGNVAALMDARPALDVLADMFADVSSTDT